MSNNYPHRGPPAKDSRPDQGFGASNHLRLGDYNFYRQSQEPSSHLSSSTCYPSSSSSRASMGPSYSSQRSDNSTLSLLNSCGLEPKDLSLLAELPEEVLTLESLPHLLTQIKGKRGTIKPYPRTPSSSSSSFSRPTSSSSLPAASASSEWERIRTQPVQYPLDHSYLTLKPLPPEQVQDWQDRWGNPRQTGSAGSKPSSNSEPSSSSSSTAYIVDYNHRDKPTDYGKKGRDNSYSSRSDRPSYSSPAVGNSSRKPPQLSSQSGDADYRFAPPPEEYRPKARADRRERDASYNTGRLSAAQKMPSRKAALDFHGTSPVAYPYSCSLCDITVLSEKFWVQHINGAQHADGQLNLLQQFPDWDCRMETIRKADDQAEKPKDDGGTAQHSQTTNQSSYQHPNKKTQKKSIANSKVVCAKFAAQSVDENYLRTLTDPFGKIVKVLMFPALAFVEMGSVDQAKDLVKYYSSNPIKAKGEEITFYASPTLNFLQSSRVVSFTPAPSAKDGHSDLIAIVKRFGPPLYTLFLPSLAFVEMKNAPDAQKLVEYYSSNTLKIDGETIKVAFSGEYNTLMRMSSAKKYEEESSGKKRSRSPSPRRRDDDSHSKRRRRSREQEEERKGEKSSRERRNRSRSSDRSSRSRRSHSSDVRSKEKGSVPDKKQPSEAESKADKPAPSSSSKSETKRETSDNEGQIKTPPLSIEEPAAPTEEEAGSSGEESDIEGMEVIGEDGENLEDEDMEILDDTDGEEGEKEEEGRMTAEEEAAKEGEPAETTTGLEKGEEEETKEEAAEQEKQEEDTEMREEEEKEDVEKGEEEEVPELEETSGIEVEEAGPAVEASASGSEPQADGDTQQTTVTPPEEDEEEEPDFPVDLENCITLDELVVEEEEESDTQDGESKDKTEPSPGRVMYFRNLTNRYYTDADFVRLVKDFGEVTRYFLIRSRREGFIEMASSSEAVRAVKEFRCKKVFFRGSVLTVQLSRKYRRLTEGWKWEPEDEKRDRRSRSSRTSERISTRSQSRSKTTEEEEEEDYNKKRVEREELIKKLSKRKDSAKKTPEKETSAKKTPEKETSAEKTPEKETSAKKTPEKETSAKKTTETETSAKETPEKETSAEKTLEKETSAEKTPEKETSAEKTLEKETSAEKTLEKEVSAEKIPEKESAKKTPEKESAKKTPEKESAEKIPEKESAKRCAVVEEDKPKEKVVGSEEASSKPGSKDQEESEVGADEPSHVTEDPQKADAGKESTSGDVIKDDVEQQTCSVAEAEQQADPVETAEELVKPTKPVGAEFVRPVVGYFCNLCQVIYADEDEAKNEHCSTISHYQKYKEHTGRDPWAS